MKTINIVLLILSSMFFDACATSNKDIKNVKPLIIQEMDTTNTIILSNRAPDNLKSYVSYVRHKIYLNTKRYLYTRQNKIDGRVDVKFKILPNGNVKIMKLSGNRNLYPITRNIIKKSFPIYPNNNVIKKSLPITINIGLNYKLHKNN